MDNDVLSIKNILAAISAPLTFLLGLAGWHYKNVCHKIEEIDDSTNKLQILVHEHSVHVSHLNDSFKRLDRKMDTIINKINSL